MELREVKGLELAARYRITHSGGQWYVPSQTGSGQYRVNPFAPSCTCDDFALIGPRPCKHVFAVKYTIERERATGFSPAAMPAPEPVPRKTYRQDWPAYELASVREKDHFQELLADLCSGIPEPAPKGGRKGGRPSIPMRDAAFATIFKVYCGMSSRRFVCDLRDAADRGYMLKPIGYSAVTKMMEAEPLTPILYDLIRQTAAPFAEIETDFAVDSSGFCTNSYTRWHDVRHGDRTVQHWVKPHIIVGVRTNIVAAVEIHDKHTHDCNILPSLVETTSKTFTIREVSADKAYTATANFEAVARHGGTLYAPFKAKTTAKAGGIFEKMFHLFCLNREDYLRHYHNRSNVESTFSSVKRKFGEMVRSKTPTAQENETLCKFVGFNICCLIQAIYELGLSPRFWDRGDETERAVIPFPEVG